MRILSLAVFAVCSLGLVSSSGCGSSKNTVAGKASYKGTDLTQGRVIFHFDGGKKAEGPIMDGKYFVENTIVGTAKITIEVPEPMKGTDVGVVKKIDPPKDVKGAVEPGEKAVKFKPPVPIDAKYKDVNTSGLTFTSKGGTETFDLILP